ncbi:hypothetical protein AGMMS49940_18100 [Spirochaetia bacterium]|nr:hypothetical protein AGMMS49940_18100 [Spirochaetia bacterium]
MYLFDTFEGFDEKDVMVDVKNEYSRSRDDFSNTSLSLVLSKMKYPENCIIKKGYFPETAEGIDEQYVFVSIDVDLFQPIYNGLCYFYPRLKHGGYIFVYDYNYVPYSGTKEAVKKFSKEYGVSYFPLSDDSGSVVFIK